MKFLIPTDKFEEKKINQADNLSFREKLNIGYYRNILLC